MKINTYTEIENKSFSIYEGKIGNFVLSVNNNNSYHGICPSHFCVMAI